MGHLEQSIHDYFEENLLGITDINELIRLESKGFKKAMRYIFELDEDIKINLDFLKDLHHEIFGGIYEWAGKIRRHYTNFGVPPHLIYQSLIQFEKNLEYRLQEVDKTNFEEVTHLLAEVHYNIVAIHPFENGNGRLSRLTTVLVGLQLDYPPFEIGIDEDNVRERYLKEIKKCGKGDFSGLQTMIKNAINRSLSSYQSIAK